jgi:hypothetical protein
MNQSKIVGNIKNNLNSIRRVKEIDYSILSTQNQDYNSTCPTNTYTNKIERIINDKMCEGNKEHMLNNLFYNLLNEQGTSSLSELKSMLLFKLLRPDDWKEAVKSCLDEFITENFLNCGKREELKGDGCKSLRRSEADRNFNTDSIKSNACLHKDMPHYAKVRL